MYEVKEGCPGCGTCLNRCPVDAIIINGLGVIITDSCIDCGICESSCPIGLIFKAAAAETFSIITSEGGNEDG